MELTPSQKGALAEAAFAFHATRLGFGISRPVGEGERYDLILDARPSLLRVQCKWGSKRGDVIAVSLRTHRVSYTRSITTTYTAEEVDAVGVYCPALDRCFLVPIEVVSGRRGLYLRLAPSKNNQRTGVN